MSSYRMVVLALLALSTDSISASDWPRAASEQALCRSDDVGPCTHVVKDGPSLRSSEIRAVLGACADASEASFVAGFENNDPGSVSTAQLWSNPATWNGNVPAAGAQVLIPAGKRVVLDVVTPILNTLTIEGQLLASQNVDIGISANFIEVRGTAARLQIGCEAQRYTRSANLRFVGTNRLLSITGMGNKALVAHGGGTLSLFGEQRGAWTKLAQNASVGASSINLLSIPSGWRTGDQLIIAPSSIDAEEFDLVQITAINGQQVSFTPALRYAHWGQLQNYGGKVLDERAAVGLLSRNVTLQSAGDADAIKFGGHVMIMAGSSAQVAAANTTHVFERYTGFKNYSGAWLEDRRTELRDSILADNGSGVVMLRAVMDGNVIVGQSANTIGETPPFIGGFGLGTSGAVHLPSSHGGARAPIIRNTQVFNQRSAALTFDVDDVGLGSEVSNLSVSNTPQRLLFQETPENPDTTLHFDDASGSTRADGQPSRWFKRRLECNYQQLRKLCD
ncbi:hypothetical protein HC761_01010 [bacterium]|nr:hypothetical protein [bacterium]